MLDPKTFYKKLDSLLVKIGSEKSGKDFLFTIVTDLEKTFGYDLKIGNGRIFEEAGDDYILVSSTVSKPSKTSLKIPIESEALQAVLKSKTYIFDDPSLTIDSSLRNQDWYSIPAAITVRGSDYRWIVIFELRSGWVREEIELCLNAVRTMINYRLFNDAVKTGMEQAAHIQQSLLPITAPEFPGFKIEAISRPAELVGGDLYDYFNFGNKTLGFCIGDASGHGLPAALLARDVVTGLRMGLEKHMKMVYTFEKLNSVIYRSVYSTNFISLFYGEVDKNGNLLYVNAGHPSALLFDGENFKELEATGLLFGALPEIDLHRGHAYLKPGSLLVLYTDGIMERKNFRSEDFGLERIKKTIVENKDKSVKQIAGEIFKAASKFGNNKKWEDDATLVVLRRDEEKAARLL